MAVKGNDIGRIEQSKGLYDNPGQMKAASFLIDSFSDDSTYKRDISPDTLNIHFILEGGGPEIRAKTYRIYHKRSVVNVMDTAIGWLEESLKKCWDVHLLFLLSALAVHIMRRHHYY